MKRRQFIESVFTAGAAALGVGAVAVNLPRLTGAMPAQSMPEALQAAGFHLAGETAPRPHLNVPRLQAWYSIQHAAWYLQADVLRDPTDSDYWFFACGFVTRPKDIMPVRDEMLAVLARTRRA